MMSIMLTRPLLLLAALSCVAACSDGPPDPQGTYHVAITTTALSNDVFPVTVKWPVAGELTLALDPAGHAKVTFLGSPGLLTGQRNHADGTLEIDMNSNFSPTFIDVSACQRAIPGSGSTYFELYFLDDQVHGGTADAVTCQLSNDIVSMGYVFELVGNRVAQ